MEILIVLAGIVYILYKFCEDINKYDEKKTWSMFGLVLLALAGVFVVGIAAQHIGESILFILLAGCIIAMCVIYFSSTKGSGKVPTTADKERLREQANKETPTESDILSVRQKRFNENGEYVSDDIAVKLWREQRYEQLVQELTEKLQDK